MTAMATLYGTRHGFRVLRQVFFEIFGILYHIISNNGNIITLNLDK